MEFHVGEENTKRKFLNCLYYIHNTKFGLRSWFRFLTCLRHSETMYINCSIFATSVLGKLQEAKKFLKRLQFVSEKAEVLRQLEGLINKLLQRGWELPKEAEKLSLEPESSLELSACGLECGFLNQRLRDLDNDRRDQWFLEPISSWVNLQFRKSQADVKHLEQVLAQECVDSQDSSHVEESEGESAGECWSGPILLSTSGTDKLQAISMVLAPSMSESAHFTRQILTALNFCRIDGLFACHKQSCPLAVEGLLWRIRNGHLRVPVMVVALPEQLCVESQEEIQRQLDDCKNALKETGKFLVIVVADDRSKLFHRLTEFRRADLEAAARSLSDEELQQICPFKEVELLEGEPLCGKSTAVPSNPSARLALRPDLNELEFCRLCRRICRDGQSPELVLDFGWTEIDAKMASLGMLLLPLLLFGVAGVSLAYPLCLHTPREHGGKKKLILEVGPVEKIAFFGSLRNERHWHAIPSRDAESTETLQLGPPPFPNVQALVDKKSQAESMTQFLETEVVKALEKDGKEKFNQMNHPYTHTLASLREMLSIFKSLSFWRKSEKTATHAPIIVLLGETGTGKTYLLTKAFELYGRYVEQVDRRVLSLSQAINPYRLGLFMCRDSRCK